MANYTKPVKFNIVLNSQYPSELTIGNDANNLSYEFNWTNIPRGTYMMSFAYRGLNNADFVANDSPQIFLSLGVVPSVYEANTGGRSMVSSYIGTLRTETHAAGQVYFYSNLTDNPAVYYQSLPSSGPISVQIFKSDFTTPFRTGGGNELGEYVLVLSFERVHGCDC